jgi:outer membrane protein OmpA-like peptidoglycan-associated protein
MFKKILITLMIVFMAVSVSTARELEGVTMPETLPVGSDVLGLNGIGLRNLMVIKVYVAGLYLKSGSTDPAAIINADEPMVMRLQMLRETKPKTMNQALLNGMRNSVGAGFSQISDRVDKFKAMIYDPLLEGDVFNFIYTPGKGLDVYKGKEHRGTVPGLDFKKAFFGIWLNDSKPADEGLKEGLIAGKFTTELAAITEKAKQEQEAKVAAEAQAQADAAAAAAAKKAEDDAKLAAATAAAVGAQASAEAAKKIDEVKKAEKQVAAAVVSAEDAAAAEAKKVADQAKAAEKAAAAATAKAEAEAKEAADMAKLEAYASADQFAADDVYFNINSTKLNAAAKMNLARKVKYLKANPGATVVLEPVCDTQGAKEKNIALANKRGDSVREFIIGAGIDASRIETVDVRQVDATGPYVNNRRVHLSIK